MGYSSGKIPESWVLGFALTCVLMETIHLNTACQVALQLQVGCKSIASQLQVNSQVNSQNDSLANTPMTTNRILNQASQIQKSALSSLDTGAYIIQVASPPSDWLPSSGYGVLFIYGSKSNYHHMIFTNDVGMWKINLNNTTVGGWQSCVPTYMDVDCVLAAAGGAVQINSSSSYKVSYTNFINCYVVGTNDVVAQVNTYSNLLYVKFYLNNGNNAPAATYKLRCWYYPN